MHHYTRFNPGDFARHAGAKVRVCELRWDDVHGEFQYLIQTAPLRDNAFWVSERTLSHD